MRGPTVVPPLSVRWASARSTGEPTFDPGAPCNHGHVSPRWTNNGICIECKRARDNAYNAAHKTEHRARSRASVLTRIEAVAQYQYHYYRAHPDKAKLRAKQWEERNPDQVAVIRATQRATRIGARMGSRKAYRAFAHHVRTAVSIPCYWCGCATRRGGRHKDHIIPISRGGADAVENLAVSCPQCNWRKNSRLPEEFTGQSELRFA